jgi:hypothetical protein
MKFNEFQDTPRPFKDWIIDDYTVTKYYGKDSIFCFWYRNGLTSFKDYNQNGKYDGRVVLKCLKYLSPKEKENIYDEIQKEIKIRRRIALEKQDIIDEEILAKAIAEQVLEYRQVEVEVKPISWFQKIIYKFRYKANK